MKKLILLFLFPLFLNAADSKDSPQPWTKLLDSDQGQYSVSMEPKSKKIEITKVKEMGKNSPRYLRLRVSRRNDRPFEVHLRTIDQPESPLKYTGQIKQWNESCIGFQLEFSFDKKTWKRLGHTLIP